MNASNSASALRIKTFPQGEAILLGVEAQSDIVQMARSKDIAPNLGRLSRSQVAARRGLHKGEHRQPVMTESVVLMSTVGKKTSTASAKKEAPEFTEKPVGGKGNGEKRSVPTAKASKYYPAEDVRRPRASRKTAAKTGLRSSITPGTVLILLSGRFSGKRVVCLKQLESGLLLVTGPFKWVAMSSALLADNCRLNGVPLRRVSQAYVIATSTKVDLSSISLPESVNDSYFAKAKAAKSSKEGEFFGSAEGEKKALPEEKKSEQKVCPSVVE